MRRRATAALVMAASCVIAACGGGAGVADILVDRPQGGSTQKLEADKIESTSFSGINQPRTAVATDNAAWAELWRQHKDKTSNPPPPPTVAFPGETVAGIFLGDGSACRQINVESVTVERGSSSAVARVNYGVIEPGPADACIAVVAQPSLLTRITNPYRLPLEFNRLPGMFALRSLAVGQPTAIPGSDVSVEVLGVDDSRCPSTAVCIWMGEAQVRLRVTQGGTAHSVTVGTRGASASAAGWELSLLRVDPYPTSGPLPADQYRVDIAYRRI